MFDALDEVVESGRRTAKVHYNARGWVLHHNFDPNHKINGSYSYEKNNAANTWGVWPFRFPGGAFRQPQASSSTRIAVRSCPKVTKQPKVRA